MQQTSFVRNAGFGVLAALLAGVAWIALATYNPDAGSGHFTLFAAEYHIEIMLALMVTAIAFGFFVSQFFYAELQRSRQASSSIMDTVLLFLGREEREIVRYLVSRGGETTQAEISRLPGMSRVKAHRSLQKMQEKQLLDVIPHGKVRRIVLKPHIIGTLKK